jgi:inner membrane protein
MDNLTHTVTGLLLSRAGLHRFHKRATPILMVSANAPDLDVISLIGGPVEYLAHHRGITHAFAAIPMMAITTLLLCGYWLWKDRKQGEPLRLLPALLLGCIGGLSHILLDWTNLYGIRLLLPFDATWFNLSITHVVDLWIWAVYGFALFWPFLARLVQGEIGAKRTAGRGMAILALLFVIAYDTTRFVLHSQAVALQSARIYEGENPRVVLAGPSPVNPLEWRGIVETESAFFVQPINLLLPFDPTEANYLPKPDSIPAREAIVTSRPFQLLDDFAPALYVRTMAGADGAVLVEAIDLRFGDPPENRFKLTATVGADGRLRGIK